MDIRHRPLSKLFSFHLRWRFWLPIGIGSSLLVVNPVWSVPAIEPLSPDLCAVQPSAAPERSQPSHPCVPPPNPAPNSSAHPEKVITPGFVADLPATPGQGAAALSAPESIPTIAFASHSTLQQLASQAESTPTQQWVAQDWQVAQAAIVSLPTVVSFQAIGDLDEIKLKQLESDAHNSLDSNPVQLGFAHHFTGEQGVAQQSGGSDSVNPGRQNPLNPGRDIYRVQEQQPELPRFLNPDIAPPPPINPNPEDDQAQPPPCENFDIDLGCPGIGFPPAPAAAPRAPVAYLIPRFDFFNSSNVYSQLVQVQDALIRPGVTFLLIPPLGRNTFFISSVEGNFVRYSSLSEIDYNELRLRAGIYQRLSPSMFGEIGWSNQQLFIARDKILGLPKGTRFFNEHSIRLELSRRDQLAKRLALNSFYQFRYSFTDPDDQSRIVNALVLSLNYDLIPTKLQAGLDYQLSISNFTRQNRDDVYHQLLARLSYTVFRNTQLSAFAGYTFGNSTDPLVDFNSFITGISLTVNVPLF